MEKEMQHFEDYCASTISKGPSRIIKHCGYVVHDFTEARWPGQGGGSGSRNPNSENMNGEEGVAPLEEEGREASLEEKWKALLMSAVALLSLAYQCLTGYIDGVATKLYFSSSLGFRPANVPIRIFVSHASGYRRNSKSKSSGTTKHFATRLEVRYKPPRRSGNTNYIHLCMCDTDEEARIYKKIASHYYSEQNDGKLDFGNGDYFVIPSMPIELEQVLSVKESMFSLGKRAWVRDKVKEVYKDFLKAKDARSQPDIANNTDCAGDHDLAVNLISAPLSGGPSVALDHGFGVEEVEMMNLPPVHEDNADPFWDFLG